MAKKATRSSIGRSDRWFIPPAKRRRNRGKLSSETIKNPSSKKKEVTDYQTTRWALPPPTVDVGVDWRPARCLVGSELRTQARRR
jgi:hypothetical protein